MPQVHLADETLMAYADGELDDSVVAAVEAAMRNDPGVPSRITAFIRSRQLARRPRLPHVTSLFEGHKLNVCTT